MSRRRCIPASLLALLAFSPLALRAQQPSTPAPLAASARCFGCHNNLKTASGKDVSIGSAWSASIMANAARDPYWQGSVRRETLDHPAASAAIQSECASCHMPLQHFADKAAGHDTPVFAVLPLDAHHDAEASADGVGCTACHLAHPEGLGTPASYDGNLVYARPGMTASMLSRRGESMRENQPDRTRRRARVRW